MKQKTITKGTNTKIRSLTSLNQIEYAALLPIFGELVERKLANYTLKGKPRQRLGFKEQANSSLLGSERKLEFMLMYLKENPNQTYHGYAFGISQAKVSEWVHFLSPVLEDALKKMGFMPQTGDTYRSEDEDAEYLLVDVTERAVPRRSDFEAQKEEYSGKKKYHTIKNLAITDHKGYVLFLSASYEGTVHDKTLWDDLDIEEVEQNMLADLGFLGIEKTHANAILPYKKPKKGELTSSQKKINSAIGSLRVKVEHAFSGIKILKIIRNKIRLKSYDIRDQVMRVATAIHNLRMSFRQPINNQS